LPKGQKFIEISPKSITDSINIKDDSRAMIYGFANINVSNFNKKAVRTVVENAESVASYKHFRA
jgi:hypothetical protein